MSTELAESVEPAVQAAPVKRAGSRPPDFKDGDIAIWKENIGANNTAVFKISDGPRGGPWINSTMLQKAQGTQLMVEDAYDLYRNICVPVECRGSKGPYPAIIHPTERITTERESNGKTYTNTRIELGCAFLQFSKAEKARHAEAVKTRPDDVMQEYGYTVKGPGEDAPGVKMPGVNFFKNISVGEKVEGQKSRWLELDPAQCYRLLAGEALEIDLPPHREQPAIRVGVTLESVEEKMLGEEGAQRLSRNAKVKAVMLEEILDQGEAESFAPEEEEAGVSLGA